jgi:UDP-glucose 4-epimerase
MRVCVTGGAGFLGSYIVDALLLDGHTVMVMDDCSSGTRGNLPVSERMMFCHIDLRNTGPTTMEIMEFEPDVIYHLAANAREGASFYQPVSVTGRNTGAYANVLSAGIKAGMKRMILFSSLAAYGDQEPPFTEDMPLKPVDVYGLAKAQMEDMTKMMADCHGFEYVIFRPFNVYGPRQAINDIHRNVFGIWMNKIMRNEPVTIYGDGQQKRAFSYIEDSVPCYINAMNCEPNQTFNIGSDRPYTVVNAAALTMDAMRKYLDIEKPIEFLPDRYGEVKFAYCDVEKARTMLGFYGDTLLSDGLDTMASYVAKRGPQEWHNYDQLEIVNEKTPENWR